MTPTTNAQNSQINATLFDELPEPEKTPAKPLSDTVMLGMAGGGLMALAAAFLWRDLSLSPAYLVTAGATAGLAASMAVGRRSISGLGILGLFAATLTGGVWYALHRTPLLLPGLAVAFVAAVLNLLRTYPLARQHGDRMRIGQIFTLLVMSTLTTTSAAYFHFLARNGDSVHVGRRLVLAILWSLLGAGLVVAGGKLKEAAMRYSGYAFIVVAMLKCLLYDTVHLQGSLRVGVLGLSGALLMLGAVLTRRLAPQR